MTAENFANAYNRDLLDEVYRQFQADPASVDPSWRAFFAGMQFAGTLPGNPGVHTPGSPQADILRQTATVRLVTAYRELGHLQAHIDPLNPPPPPHPMLALERFGLKFAAAEEGKGTTWKLEIREDSVESSGDLGGVSSLDEDWVTLNQMIKFYKFGFGKVSEYVNEEIRLERMSRERAVELVEKYDGLCSDAYVEGFCEFLEITAGQFWEKVRASVNRDLFEIGTDGSIQRLFKVGVGI